MKDNTNNTLGVYYRGKPVIMKAGQVDGVMIREEVLMWGNVLRVSVFLNGAKIEFDFTTDQKKEAETFMNKIIKLI